MKKHANIGMGFFCVGLGVLGAFLPVMPSTCFFIFAAYFFGKSSEKFENWLLNHKKFGPPVVAWRQNRSIPVHAKWLATAGMSSSILIVYLGQGITWILAVTIAVIIPSGIYVWTRPS